MNTAKDAVLEQVLARELDMFLRVPTDGPCECKENQEQFAVQRRAQFQAWSERTLASYLADLEAAEAQNLNLMTVKYARMDGRIPPFNASPRIPELVEILLSWQREFLARHARLGERARPLEREEGQNAARSFRRYLSAELATYSEATLTRLLEDVRAKQRAGINMSEEIYRYLVQELGYGSIDAAEASLQGRGPPAPGQ